MSSFTRKQFGIAAAIGLLISFGIGRFSVQSTPVAPVQSQPIESSQVPAASLAERISLAGADAISAKAQRLSRMVETDVRVVDLGSIETGESEASENVSEINAALLAHKGLHYGLTPKVEIRFPPGVYYLDAPIVAWPGERLVGNQTTLKEASGFKGNCLIELRGVDSQGITYYYHGGVRDFSFQTSSTNVAAIRSTTGVLANSLFKDLILDTYQGLILSDSYCQDLDIDTIFSQGPANTILTLAGNWNHIHNLDKEGGTGTEAGPYVQIGKTGTDSVGNVLERILIEGAGHANKWPLSLIRAHSFSLRDWWDEITLTSGYTIKVVDTKVGKITGQFIYDPSDEKLQLENSQGIKLDEWYGPGFGQNVDAVLDVDAKSDLTVGTLYTNLDIDVNRISTANRIRLERILVNGIRDVPQTGISYHVIPHITGGNLLVVNPSFEADVSGWTNQYPTESPVVTHPPSPVCPGNMLKLAWKSSPGLQQLYQTYNVTAAQVGKPFTFCFLCNVTGGDGWLNPIVSGCGIIGDTNYTRCNAAGGWQLCAKTFTPQSPGELLLGFNFLRISGVEIDACALRIGTEAIPDL